MTRRTEEEKKKDFVKIQRAVKKSNSIADICRLTGCSYFIVKKTLADHPVVEKRVMEKFAMKRSAGDKSKKESVGLLNASTKKRYVMDASFTGNCAFSKKIYNIISSKDSMIVLTNVTIDELDALQKQDEDYAKAHDSRELLNIALEESEKVELVKIDENFKTPDDCIINYCTEHKKDTILVTSDKVMALKARLEGITVDFVKYEKKEVEKSNDIKKSKDKNSKERVLTLYEACFINKTLIVKTGWSSSYKKYCAVFKNGILTKNSSTTLALEDELYIAKEHHDYITFSHFKICSLERENNCKCIFCKKIFKKDLNREIAKLDEICYKNFLKKFVEKTFK